MKVLASIILAFTLTTAVAADKKSAPEMTPEQKEMMQKMKEYGTPGEGHKVLAGMVGKWTYTSKGWESAESAPMESKGKSTFSMILGGRFLQQTVKGEAMGMPFEGMNLVGYDNQSKKYNTLWIDTMTTGMVKGEGTFDAATQTLTDNGEFMCPARGTVEKYRSEWKILDKNSMTFAMYGRGMKGDTEFKMMEMTYKRSK
jgi:uncharacterized membrane protein